MTPVAVDNSTKYEHVSFDASSQELQSDPHFNSFIFRDATKIAEAVVAYHSSRKIPNRQRVMEVRGKIAKFAALYLEKISPYLEEGKREAAAAQIELLKTSDPEKTIIIMSAHQPNLFAYSGILRKAALLKAIEQKVRERVGPDVLVLSFYAFADHDFVHNKWVRSAEMPAPLKRDGVLRFNINLEKKEDIFLPSNKTQKPSDEKLASWRTQINDWISENSSLAAKYSKAYALKLDPNAIAGMAKGNFEQFWSQVEKIHTNASSLAQFSSNLLATIVLNALDTPIIFANFSDCYGILGDEYEWLLSNVKEYSDTIEQNELVLKSIGVSSGLASDVSELLPFWIKCSCGSKYRMSSSSSMKFYGKCMRCSSEVVYTMDELKSLLKSSPASFEPRSIGMPLALSRAFDMSCYIGGIGGMGYLMHSKAIADKLGSPFPPTPFWNVPDQYTSIETLAAAWETRRISDAYTIKYDGAMLPQSVIDVASMVSEQLNAKMEKGEVPKTAVSERDRQVIERIPESLRRSSCAVGYAINIGLTSTYRQWIEFLASGGTLQSTVDLRSVFTK